MNKILTSHLRGLLNSPTDFAILSLDLSGNLILWNAGAAALFDLTSDMAGINVSHLLDGYPGACLTTQMQEALASGRSSLSGWYRSVTHERFWAEGTLSPVYDDNQQHVGYLKIVRDASERQKAEQDVLVALQTDDLTGLANRAAFHSRLHQLLGSSSRRPSMFILHMFDLDYFKAVNDSLGHQAGDVLLHQVATRIRAACRETDMVARLGGDEFAIIQGDVSTPSDGSLLAEKVLAAIALPFDLGESQARVSASIGLAIAPQDGSRPDDLLRKADAALYRAKHNGRAGYSFFTRALDVEAQTRHRDIVALRDAVKARAFFVVYQPKISPVDRRVVGMEALLRCSDPRLARLPIRELIRLAEDSGQMHHLSDWVLQQALSQRKTWFERGHPKFKMCVNLCARELESSSTLDLIDKGLHQAGLQPGDLGVELTERELFDSKAEGIKVLRALNDRGVTIAIDDFGTGYTSLSYLTSLPVSLIKLHSSFTRRLPQDAGIRKVVGAIIALAHALELQVVAEGIERQGQFDTMREMRCDAVQGYFLSRPLPPHQMEKWLNEHARAMKNNDAARGAAREP